MDSKTQYVAVCNALETLLVNEQIAAALLPPLKAALESKGVRIRGDAATREIIAVEAATDYIERALRGSYRPGRGSVAVLDHFGAAPPITR